MSKSLSIQVPGKLMIAGEFAVLEPYHRLMTMAVNRFIYIDVIASNDKQITLAKFNLTDLHWDFANNRATIFTNDKRANFVQEAMSISFLYLKEKGIEIEPFSMEIKSELDDQSTGKKYGLGSSAAVSVGVIKAILQFHLNESPSPELVFKLAAISHVAAQGNGSGADVAASAYGGIILYSSFQADWLRKKYQEANSLLQLLEMEWEYFFIQPITLPKDVHICIGWTGSPASTGNLVERILQLKNENVYSYDKFLERSKVAVNSILRGIETNDIPKFLTGITENRQALIAVGKAANTTLETPEISTLCDIAEVLGGAAKQSGAGGGDCGIAFMPSQQSANMLMKEWKSKGITPLELQPFHNGLTN
ncbi:phosphomevalonate kinase [Ornithinibacillus halotolerans]|uniref:phosphomevalonate kinase n=1 Tax=Ornithinibacillus halotolerans TaxID=1274357 RepID=A0A916S150_9BACI|nr:phosphomevalonate kinase [Ornithinibacillus halotolerans]